MQHTVGDFYCNDEILNHQTSSSSGNYIFGHVVVSLSTGVLKASEHSLRMQQGKVHSCSSTVLDSCIILHPPRKEIVFLQLLSWSVASAAQSKSVAPRYRNRNLRIYFETVNFFYLN